MKHSHGRQTTLPYAKGRQAPCFMHPNVSRHVLTDTVWWHLQMRGDV
jgi:hypothetical protein